MMSRQYRTILNIRQKVKLGSQIGQLALFPSFRTTQRLEHLKVKAKQCEFLSMISLSRKVSFNFTTQVLGQSLIESLGEYKSGSGMLLKGQYPTAIRQFEMALKFLPKNVQGYEKYKPQYQGLLKKLLEAHVMMNKSIKNFKQNYQQYLDNDTDFSKFVQVLQLIQTDDFRSLQSMQTQDKLWKQLVRALAFKNSKQCFGKWINIQKVAQTKSLALKYIGLYLYEKIKGRKNKQRENIYLNTCRQFLKQTQKSQPQKIVKPLSLMACNLLAGDQFLQAEGLMSHCLSVAQEFHVQSPSYLKFDQEYILCKLLIGRVFEGVNRQAQNLKIQEQYGKIFDQKKLIIQQLLHVNLGEL